MRTRDSLATQDGGQLGRQLLDAVRRCRQGGLAMAGKVVGEQPVAIRQAAKAVPQVMRHAEAMQHHQWFATAAAMKADGSRVEWLGLAIRHQGLRQQMRGAGIVSQVERIEDWPPQTGRR